MIDLSGLEGLGNAMNKIQEQLNTSIIELQKLRSQAENHALLEQLEQFDKEIENINKQKKELDAINS